MITRLRLPIPLNQPLLMLLLTATMSPDCCGQSADPAAEAQPTVSEVDYTRLSAADVADATGLTVEQKAAAAEIIKSRDTALTTADDAAKQGIHADAEKQLQGLLTEDQQRLFLTLFSAKKLRFNFRYQKWADVLDWVAREADLSLIMDTPPPGTFHYSDSRDYTTTEALDLLNGWLLTKGFTLIRRERMLMCLNLKDGLPEGAVPRITPEELATRGRFEFLSILIPLAGRPAEAVLKEIKPLLGSYGSAEALEQTGQLLVSDTSATLRVIEQVVQKVPLPQKPAAPPAPAPAPVPVLVVYPVQHATPKKAGELLKQIISGTLVVDEDARQISLNAVPAEQEKAKAMIAQLDSNQGPDSQPSLQLYPLPAGAADQLMATLKLVAPAAQFRHDPVENKLVTWAAPSEHQAISNSLEKLGQQAGDDTRQLNVYPLKHVDPAAAQSMVQSLLPAVRLTVDSKSRSLLALASLTDQQALSAMIEQLESEAGNTESSRELRSYPVSSSTAAAAVTLLATILPEVRVTNDVPHQRLLVLASATEHERVAASMRSISENPVPEKQVSVYEAVGLDAASVTALLTALVPQATVTHDTVNRRLIIVGTPKEQETATGVLEQVRNAPRKLKLYAVDSADVASVTALLTTLAPQATLTADAANRRLVVVASEADHAVVGEAIQQLGMEHGAEKTVLKAYPLKPKTTVSTITLLLKTIVPNASVTPDETSRRLLITADETDHSAVAELIAQIESSGEGSLPELQFYPLQKASGTSATVILKSIAPSAQITFEQDTSRLSVVATNEDHAAIAATLEKLETTTPEKQKRTLRIYDVTSTQKTRFQAVSAGLTAELPGLQVIADAQQGELAVWATETQHEAVAEILTQLRRAVPPEQQSALIVYPITKVDPAGIVTVLTTLFPDASITADAKGSRLLVHARPAVQEVIRRAIEQLDTDIPAEKEIKLMAYPVGGINSASAQQLIQAEFPDIIVIPDTTAETLIVRGRIKAHERVAEILDSLRSSSASLTERRAVVYPSMFSDQSRANDFFSGAFPKARVIVDPAARRMTVWGTEAEHESIRDTVAEMRQPVDGEPVASLATYKIQNIPAASLTTMLSKAVPEAQVVLTADGQRLLAWANPEEQEKISGIVEQARQGLMEQGRTLQIFDLGNLNTGLATQALTAAVPQVSFLRDTTGRSIMAWLDAEEHNAVKSILNQLSESDVVGGQRDLKFYEIGQVGGSDARTLLVTTYPDVTFTSTADGQKLMALVTKDRDTDIRKTLETLKIEQPFQVTRTMELYSTRDLGPSVTTVLAQAVPKASISPGAKSDQLAIVASAEDHVKIAQVLQQLRNTVEFPPEKTLTIHQIAGVSPAAVQQVLQPLMDAEVQLTFDSTGRQLYVRAFPFKQNEIRETIAQIMANLSTTQGRTTRTYAVGAPNADEAQEVLQALYPDAKFVTDQDRKLLVATALPEQHETIALIADQLRGVGLDAALPQPEIYSLKHGDAREVHSLLQSLYRNFADVRISVNEQTGRLVAVATKEQHEAIRKLIDELDRASSEEEPHELAVFRLHRSDGNSIQQALKPLLPGSAVVTVDRTGGHLLISARSEDMTAIRELAKKVLETESSSGSVTATYRLLPNEADEAQEALAAMFPDATLVTDRNDEVLIATATPEQHGTIRSVVEQMTSHRTGENAPIARAYVLGTADGENTVQVLQGLFQPRDNVRLSYDRKAGTVIAAASPRQHETIREFLDQLDPAGRNAGPRRLEIYSLTSINGRTAVEIIKGVLQPADAAATVTWEADSENLIVTTSEAGHALVKETVDRLNVEDNREVDVIQLSFLTASTAQTSVESVFSDNYSNMDNLPLIQADDDAQQLLIRATPEQLQQIRELLIKMGETSLSADSGSQSDSRNLRVLPMRGDVDSTLRRIQDLWPTIRKNRIRILRPGNKTPPQNGVKETPAEAGQPEGDSQNIPGQFSLPPESLPERTPVTPLANTSDSDGKEELKNNSLSPTNTATDTAPVPDAAPSQTDAEKAGDTDAPPDIVIVVGEDRITIASDDLEALDRLESLLRATSSGPQGGPNRDFSVFQLQNAGAEEVSRTIRAIYDSKAAQREFDPVIVVPDERMNTLIVYAKRADRERIEKLLEVMDTQQQPDSGRAFRTKVVLVRYTNAERVESVLKGIYRAELTAGGARQPMDIPAGIPPSVASIIRQMNAAASAPLLTIEVQRDTNSLVIKAPQALLDELTDVITQLDETASKNRSRGITLLPLEKTNSARVMRILGNVLNR